MTQTGGRRKPPTCSNTAKLSDESDGGSRQLFQSQQCTPMTSWQLACHHNIYGAPCLPTTSRQAPLLCVKGTAELTGAAAQLQMYGSLEPAARLQVASSSL